MPLAVDLTELPMAVRRRMHEVLTSEHAAEIVQAKIRQKKMAKFYHDNPPRAMNGIGGQTMAVDPFWIGYFNMMHGYQVWHDPDFRKWLNKQEDWFKVRHTGTKLQVGFGSTPRYRKAYPLRGGKAPEGPARQAGDSQRSSFHGNS